MKSRSSDPFLLGGGGGIEDEVLSPGNVNDETKSSHLVTQYGVIESTFAENLFGAQHGGIQDMNKKPFCTKKKLSVYLIMFLIMVGIGLVGGWVISNLLKEHNHPHPDDDDDDISNTQTEIPNIDCTILPQSAYPFCDPTLDFDTRLDDLMDRLSLEQKISQTTSIAPGIPQLGIKAYNWRSNCIHGWAQSGGEWGDLSWTIFPAPIGLAATFNKQLVRTVGGATSTEGRALHNILLRQNNGESTEAAGLNCFAPSININRDPRWGRGMENYGEDPFLTSSMGLSYLDGLQKGSNQFSSEPRQGYFRSFHSHSDVHNNFDIHSMKTDYLMVAGCAKHYMAHNGPDRVPRRRYFITKTSDYDLFDTYAPAFEVLVKCGDVAQIMPSFSGLLSTHSPDGAPMTINKYLLQDIVRDLWGGRDILMVADNHAVAHVVNWHNYSDSFVEVSALSMEATLDIDLADTILPDFLGEAVQENLVTEDQITAAVRRAFLVRMRLGEFDPFEQVPYRHLGATDIDSEKHRSINLAVARESIVLLKNDGVLPLSTELSRIAVIGPNADNLEVQLSNYEGIPSDFQFTILDGIKAAVPETTLITHDLGCADPFCEDKSLFETAILNGAAADVAILVMGLDTEIERETIDRDVIIPCEGVARDSLGLPGCQDDLIEAVVATGTPVIVVLVSGAVSVTYPNSVVSAIVHAFYPGSIGGLAVADVIVGHYNPAGRLPVTIFTDSQDLSGLDDYTMPPLDGRPGRTYRYYTGNRVLYHFGYGLSYSRFMYSDLVITNTQPLQNTNTEGDNGHCQNVIVQVRLSNIGSFDGDEVAQVYVTPPNEKGILLSLKAFERVYLRREESRILNFVLTPYQLSVCRDDGSRFVPGGDFIISVGGHQLNDIRGNDVSNVLTGTVQFQEILNIEDCDICDAFKS